MFSVTGLEFSFTQAPESMKSVLQACWLLAVAFGNVIVVIVTKVHFFNSQAYEFLLFFGLMILNVLLFIWLALRYKYRNEDDQDIEQKIETTSIDPVNGKCESHSVVNGIENVAYMKDL